MSEPVHFNTDITYYLGTDGILSFGGKERGIIDISTITWKRKDIPTVLSSLASLRSKLKLYEVNLEKYEKNKKGTLELLSDLLLKNLPRKYILGAIIAHQLQYQVPLKATFMTGYGSDASYSSCDTDD